MEDPEELLGRLDALVDAINNLAESNRQVVDLVLAQQADEEQDNEPPRYLDGTPVR